MVGMDHLPITVFVFIDMLYLCIFVRPNALRDDSVHHDTAAVIVKRPCFDPSCASSIDGHYGRSHTSPVPWLLHRRL
jgi:hypothetical protein